jgi:hypothetical protein
VIVVAAQLFCNCALSGLGAAGFLVRLSRTLKIDFCATNDRGVDDCAVVSELCRASSGRVEYTPVPLVVHLRASYQDEARSGSRQLQRLYFPPDSGQRYQSAACEEPSV